MIFYTQERNAYISTGVDHHLRFVNIPWVEKGFPLSVLSALYQQLLCVNYLNQFLQ
jgi:hypothetical protein